MKKLIYTLMVLFACSQISFTQSYVGTWKTIDDTDGAEKSYIKIYEEDGMLHGEVLKLLEAATLTHCEECEGELKGAPIVGMKILKNLKKKGSYYEDGEILDPATGKVYSCWIELEEDDKLKLRGFIGFSLLGRTQYWYRVK